MAEVLQRQTQVQEALDLVRHAVAILACRGALQLAIVDLMDDAVAAVLATDLGLLAVTVALV